MMHGDQNIKYMQKSWQHYWKNKKIRRGGCKFIINTSDVHCAICEETEVVVVPNWVTRNEDVLGSGGLA
jgi:hypothetical protein